MSSVTISHPSSSFNSVWSVFWLGLRQAVRAWKLIVLSVLFLIPSGLILTGRLIDDGPTRDESEFAFILTLIPNALLPLTCLLYASGMIQDEIEEQTLTYLLIRPIPRAFVYLGKLASVLVVSIGLTAVFTTLAYLLLYWNSGAQWLDIATTHARLAITMLAISAVGYCTLFGFMSLFLKRSVIIGVVYIILLEGVLANIDFVIRKLTVMYYFLVLRKSWIGIKEPVNNGIDLATAPSVTECISTVLIASCAFAFLGAMVFRNREFRLKTPEGN